MLKDRFRWANFLDTTIFIGLFLTLLSTARERNAGARLQGVIWSDVEGYYMYLPAVLINHDIHHLPKRSMDYRVNERGEVVDKYTCGVAYFYMPFFLLAHSYALNLHYDARGFGDPYYKGIILCGVFWAVVGLFLLRTLLRKYFSWIVTWSTLLCILYGTNFYHYSTRAMGMSHVYSFTLVSAILLQLHHYYRSPGKGKAILLGLLFGWLVLIRPTNCIFLVFFLLFNVVSWDDIKARFRFFKERVWDFTIALPFFIMTMIPQMLYWKIMLGKWISYSYGGESFIYWKHPRILAVLVDTQNGLLLYSPVLLLMFVGFILAKKDAKTNFWGVMLLFVVATYLFASWWAWWFGAAFGHRSYIEYFPVFAFPIAVAIERVFANRKIFFVAPFVVCVVLLCYYSVHLSLLSDTQGFWDGPQWRWNYHGWWHLVEVAFGH